METTRPRLLTPREAARWLRLPAARLVRLARAGLVPCVFLPGGELLFSEEDLAAWVLSRRHPQNEESASRAHRSDPNDSPAPEGGTTPASQP